MKVETKINLTEKENKVLDEFVNLMENINTQICNALNDDCCQEGCPFFNLCGNSNPKEQIINFFNDALQNSFNKQTDF